MRLCLVPVVAAVVVNVFSATAQQTPAPTPSQQLLQQFSADKTSVAYAAVAAHLRNDINSYAKPGKKVELALDADAKFNDGAEMKKGTILSGEVVEATAPGKDKGISTLVLDWTEAELPKKQKETVAVIVRDAEGGHAPKQEDAPEQNPTVANSAKMKLLLENKKAGLPQVAPGVQMLKQDRHSLSVASTDDDVVIHEQTKFIVVIFKPKS